MKYPRELTGSRRRPYSPLSGVEGVMASGEKDSQDLRDSPEPAGALVPVARSGRQPEVEDESLGKGRKLLLLPVKNAVLFPHNVVPVTPTSQWGHEALEKASRKGTLLGIVAVREGAADPLRSEDLYSFGTEAKIIKVIRFPDGTSGAVVQGTRRFRISEVHVEPERPIIASVEFPEIPAPEESIELAALERGLKQLIQKAVSLSPNIPNEANIFIENVGDPQYLADLVVPYLSIETRDKQALLEISDVQQRLRMVQKYLTREIEILEMTHRIQSEIKGEVGKQQRRYYVKEQLKLLQKELGELEGKGASSSPGQEPQDLRERVGKSAMPEEARTAALREIDRMGVMQAGSPEYSVSHTYVNSLLDMPWGVTTQKKVDLAEARKVLEAEHYGLEKVKKRVLEFLAVYALKGQLKGPILLLAGPPGVGKTSLGKSVARALGRNFQRIALGGVRDESEIRGHRRTYVGALPGKIADAIKKAGSMDPVILLDEIDKISADFRGDPSSALLEVLDSEQNHTFTDHYLNVPLDLSKVLFIGTANTLSTIQGPLRDRLEIVELDSYTPEEKVQIARRHLLTQVSEENGFAEHFELSLSDLLLADIVAGYTRESGVRQLRRELSSLVRGLVSEYVQSPQFQRNTAKPATAASKKKEIRRKALTKKDVEKILGPKKFIERTKPARLPLGVSTGLAYTPVGGDVLLIEAAAVTGGKGGLTLTGQLGDVMKESVQTALGLLKSMGSAAGADASRIVASDLHVHFPAGAVKKDGPSAGCAIFSALAGLFSDRPLPADLAMTGEISLRGDVLPVGGIKEKLLAAHRYGVKRVLIPQDNMRDLQDVPESVRKAIVVQGVRRVEEVLEAVFGVKSPKTNKVSGKRGRLS